MDCNIIKDLIPLYIDECCSEESGEAVKNHIENCPDCRNTYDLMLGEIQPEKVAAPLPSPVKIRERTASVLQSVLMFVLFGLITFGVAKEAAVPLGWGNGFWAFSLVVPSTGFMLSLANWYFVRQYKSRRIFSDFSSMITFLLCAAAFVWTLYHYEIGFTGLFNLIRSAANTGFINSLRATGGLFGIAPCAALTVLFSVLSKILSDIFAKMLGKD